MLSLLTPKHLLPALLCLTPISHADIELSIQNGSIDNLTFQKESPPKLVIQNTGASTESVTIDLMVKDTYKQAVGSRRITQTVPGHQTLSEAIPGAQQFGSFTLDYQLSSAGKNQSGTLHFTRSVSAEPSADKTAIRIGLQGLGHPANSAHAVPTGKAMGISVSRVGANWNKVQPRKGVWDWSEADARIKKITAAGIEPQMLLGYCPVWASSSKERRPAPNGQNWGDWAKYPPVNPEDWRQYIRAAAKRYKGQSQLWEIWNEADWGYFQGSTEEYLTLLKIAYEELKAVDPNNLVLTSGFASADPFGGTGRDHDLQARVLAEGQAWFDMHTMHQHGDFERLVNTVDAFLLPHRQKVGCTKPLYFNETASSSVNGEIYQAETNVKKALYCFSRGSLVYDLFLYSNNVGEHNYSIVEYGTLRAKPALPAYANLVARIQGKHFIKQLDAGDNKWALLFSDDRESVLVYWTQDALRSGSSRRATFGHARHYSSDLFGNTTPVKTGPVILNFTTTPAYLVIAKKQAPLVLSNPIAQQQKTAITFPGTPTVLEAVIHNPFNQPETIQVQWQDGKPQAISLTTGETRALTITHPADSTAKHVNLFWSISSRKISGKLSLPLVKGGKLISRSRPQQPTFICNQRSQVFDLGEADPTRYHQNWTGPKDLSAITRVYTSNNTLVIETDITDDIRTTKGFGNRLWKGESIQVSLVIPGQTGNWELGFGADQNGKSAIESYSRPAHFDDPEKLINYSETTTPNGARAVIRIPFQAIGLTPDNLSNGFRFNLLINDDDNDGMGRNGFIRVAAGLGTVKNTDLYPLLKVK